MGDTAINSCYEFLVQLLLKSMFPFFKVIFLIQFVYILTKTCILMINFNGSIMSKANNDYAEFSKICIPSLLDPMSSNDGM